MYSVNWNQPVITEYFSETAEIFRPAAVILGYPLTDYCYMKESMKKDPMIGGLFSISNSAFLGMPDPGNELLEEISPVYHVTEHVPPTFIWATASDELVPVQHSLRMAYALADKKIPFEIHIQVLLFVLGFSFSRTVRIMLSKYKMDDTESSTQNISDERYMRIEAPV